MIRLEYKERQKPALTIPSGDLEGMQYKLPVRLQVDGVELFEHVDGSRTVFTCQVEEDEIGLSLAPELRDPWVETSTAALAEKGLKLAQDACQGEPGMLYLSTGDVLQLRPLGNSEVEVYCSRSGRSARAGCEELVRAFEAFAAEVKARLGMMEGE